MTIEEIIRAALIDAYRNGWKDGASNRRNMDQRRKEDLEGNYHRCDRLSKHIVKKYDITTAQATGLEESDVAKQRKTNRIIVKLAQMVRNFVAYDAHHMGVNIRD